MKHVPNMITLFRLLLIPVFVMVFFSSLENRLLYALGIFLLAGATDALDGYLARKYDVVSVVGLVLDPLADKLMLLTALVCLFFNSEVPLWILILMAGVEGLQILTGIYLYVSKTERVIPANKFGKTATILFTIAVALLLIFPFSTLSHWVLVLAVASKLISFISYGLSFLGRQKEKQENQNS